MPWYSTVPVPIGTVCTKTLATVLRKSRLNQDLYRTVSQEKYRIFSTTVQKCPVLLHLYRVPKNRPAQIGKIASGSLNYVTKKAMYRDPSMHKGTGTYLYYLAKFMNRLSNKISSGPGYRTYRTQVPYQ